MKLLGRQHRETLTEIEAHLVAEDAARTDSGSVRLVDSVVEDVLEEIQVLSHGDERLLIWPG